MLSDNFGIPVQGVTTTLPLVRIERMIEQPTVLVLGAGASAPFNFPTGGTLMEFVCDHDIPHAIKDMFPDIPTINSFREALRLSGQPSVDAFLEKQPQFTELGKAYIAFFLIGREQEKRLFAWNGGNWYRYLFQHMGCDYKEFEKNKLGIITFNYDRSLEHFLYTALLNSSNAPDKEQTVASQLKNIRILHVHGQLGFLEWQVPSHSKDHVRPYTHDNSTMNVRIAASGIKIISEDPGSAFAGAVTLLEWAERVYFLGFGYHPTNMARLQVPSSVDINRRPYLHVGGTAFGLTYEEKEAIQKRYNIQLGHESYQIYDYLRRAMPIWAM